MNAFLGAMIFLLVVITVIIFAPVVRAALSEIGTIIRTKPALQGPYFEEE